MLITFEKCQYLTLRKCDEAVENELITKRALIVSGFADYRLFKIFMPRANLQFCIPMHFWNRYKWTSWIILTPLSRKFDDCVSKFINFITKLRTNLLKVLKTYYFATSSRVEWKQVERASGKGWIMDMGESWIINQIGENSHRSLWMQAIFVYINICRFFTTSSIYIFI